MMKVACVLLALTSAVTALPNGAPLCEIGSSNTRNKHLNITRNPKLTSVPLGGYKVTIDGIELVAKTPENPDFRNLVPFGEQVDIIVSVDPDADTPAPYLKGILLITHGNNLEDRDDLDTRTPGSLVPVSPLTKESIGCENFALASLVHEEPSEKQNLPGKFFWPVEGQVLYLDVNIVRNNNQTAGSQYSFSQYVLQTATIQAPSCGLLGLSIFCPFTFCGIFGRLLGLCSA